jgi:hypothetical protein
MWSDRGLAPLQTPSSAPRTREQTIVFPPCITVVRHGDALSV